MGTNSGCGDVGGSSVLASGCRDIGATATLILSAGSLALFLISTTFLWEFECCDGTNVGLAAGRYSGNRRPDRYRTPHALHRVFGPNGPSLHCGVFVASQWVHFLITAARCEEAFCRWAQSETSNEFSTLCGQSFVKSTPKGRWNNFFLLSLLFLAFEIFGEVEVVENSGDTKSHGFTPAGLTRFDLLRTGIALSDLIDKLFPPEQGPLLSRTETGLWVWKAPDSWTLTNLFCCGICELVASTWLDCCFCSGAPAIFRVVHSPTRKD